MPLFAAEFGADDKLSMIHKMTPKSPVTCKVYVKLFPFKLLPRLSVKPAFLSKRDDLMWVGLAEEIELVSQHSVELPSERDVGLK